MAANQSSEALRRPLNLLRGSIFAVAAVSLVLGYLGFSQYVVRVPDYGDRPIDLVYYDLQLFVLGADPLQHKGPYPTLLEIARFSAPAVTLYAFIEAGRLLFAAELSRLRARRASGHVIVCGDSAFADSLSRKLQQDGTEVIEVRAQVDDFVTAEEPLRIIGDARDPRVLEAAGVGRAAAVYACAASSTVNAAIAFASCHTHRSETAPLMVYSHIPDPDLRATLQANFLSQTPPGGTRLEFFDINDIAARHLFADDPVVPLHGRPPRLLIAGDDEFWAAAVVAAARSWRVCRPATWRLPIDLVGPTAATLSGELTRRYPFMEQVCDVTAWDDDLLPLLAGHRLTEPPDRVMVCYTDEEYALKSAMTAERWWRAQLAAVAVRLDGLADFLTDGRFPGGQHLLDAGSGVIRGFGVIRVACDPELIREDLVERLARVIHDRYRQGRSQRGEWLPGDPSLEPWDRLSPRLRQANRTQAEDIGRKLAEVRCVVTARIGQGGDAVLSDTDLDVLAQLEHERWCQEHERAGWRYAPQRSDEHKLHPGLQPWHTLPQHFQRRTHDAVRELSDILADAGFRIMRSARQG